MMPTTTPELDRLAEATERLGTEHVAAFLEWFLLEHRGTLCSWREAVPGEPCPHKGKSKSDLRHMGVLPPETVHQKGVTCPGCGMEFLGYADANRQGHGWVIPPVPAGFYPIAPFIRHEVLFAEYMGIDPKAVETERRALLASVQEPR